MAAPKTGIALVLGKPKGMPMSSGHEPDDEDDDDKMAEVAELASMALPGVKVVPAALKELIRACMETEYDE